MEHFFYELALEGLTTSADLFATFTVRCTA